MSTTTMVDRVEQYLAYRHALSAFIIDIYPHVTAHRSASG